MQTIRLTKGIGKKGRSHCVMAATSIVAGERFSDHPDCVCPTITAALISLNDAYESDEERERDLSHLPWLIIGTKGTLGHMIARAQMFAAYAAYAAAAATRAAAAAYAAATRADAAAAAAAATRAAAAAAAAAYAAAADAAAADAAAAAAYAAAADAAAAARAAAAGGGLTWKQKLVKFIETDIIPVYTTMPIEPGHRLEYLTL